VIKGYLKGLVGLAVVLFVVAVTTAAVRFIKARSLQTLEIVAPCTLLKPITVVAQTFEKETHAVPRCTFNTSRKLLDQIERGKIQPDLVLSAGGLEIEELARRGLVDLDTQRVFGEYGLLLIVPRKNPGRVASLQDLTQERVHKIAVTDPQVNALGRYTKQALVHLGLWDKVKAKVVFPRETIHSVTYVLKGKAEASFTLDGCPFRDDPHQKENEYVKIVQKLPPASHDRFFCIVARLKGSRHRKEAEQFMQYLLSPKIQRQLAKLGVPNVRAPVEANVPQGTDVLLTEDHQHGTGGRKDLPGGPGSRPDD
jgi:molybdate transport system substrate-binding protein